MNSSNLQYQPLKCDLPLIIVEIWLDLSNVASAASGIALFKLFNKRAEDSMGILNSYSSQSFNHYDAAQLY